MAILVFKRLLLLLLDHLSGISFVFALYDAPDDLVMTSFPNSKKDAMIGLLPMKLAFAACIWNSIGKKGRKKKTVKRLTGHYAHNASY